MTPIGGGVNMQPRVALSNDRITIDTGDNDLVKAEAGPADLADGQWWWD